MSFNVTLEDIQKLAKVITENDFKVFPVNKLVTRFQVACDQNPHDHIIQGMHHIMHKRAQKDTFAVITAEEIGNIYSELSSLSANSEFKNLFADILPSTVETVSPQTQSTYTSEYMRDTVRDTDVINQSKHEVDELNEANEHVANSFDSIFQALDKYKVSKFNSELIEGGKLLVNSSLNSMGIDNSHVAFKTSNDKCILYTASLDTFNGKQYVDVPLIADPIVYPTIFAWKDNVYTLDKQGLDKFYTDVQSHTASNGASSANSLRDLVTSDLVREMDVTKNPLFEVTENTELKEAQIPLPEGLGDIEAILTDAVMKKESSYKDETITAGRDLVASQLKSFSYMNQVKFAGDTNKGLKYAATIQTEKGTVNFEVPVEINQGQLQFPVVLTKNNEEYDFSPQGIQSLLHDATEAGDVTAVRFTTAYLNSDLKELKKIVEAETFKKNFAAVEEALHVIGEKFGDETLSRTLIDYQNFLTVANTNYIPRCSPCPYSESAGKYHSEDHCNLLNTACRKVVRTAKGQCTKLHMANTEEAYDGVLMANRIAF